MNIEDLTKPVREFFIPTTDSMYQIRGVDITDDLLFFQQRSGTEPDFFLYSIKDNTPVLLKNMGYERFGGDNTFAYRAPYLYTSRDHVVVFDIHDDFNIVFEHGHSMFFATYSVDQNDFYIIKSDRGRQNITIYSALKDELIVRLEFDVNTVMGEIIFH